MGLLVEEKKIVIPGEELAVGIDYLPALGTYREEDKIYSAQLGMVNFSGRLIKVISLSGRYIPKVGDTVIGNIANIGFNGWMVDIGYAYEAALSLKEATSDFIERGSDLTKYFDFGETIVANVINVTKSKMIDLSMKGPGLRKLKGGKIMEVTSSKVPRIIGKQGSMISLIKNATNCKIIVGQNGLIWISGEDLNKEMIAASAILKIEQEAHISGLTDKISEFLQQEAQNDSNLH